MNSVSMQNRKTSKQHQLGQYMTTEDVAKEMCEYFITPKDKWVVFDPTCGDGILLEAATNKLLQSGVPIHAIELYGFDIDDQMIARARARLVKSFGKGLKRLILRHCDTLQLLNGDVFLQDERKLLEDVTIVIGNPPYGKGLEVKFFEACNSYFKNKAELVFLLPISFVDSIKGTNYELLKGRPLGVTTGHVIVHHHCGNEYVRKTQREALTAVNGFSVLTGVKLYAKGDGSPPQDDETLRTKPYSSDVERPGWLPCLRTGDIKKYSYTLGRLWVKYGDHLAHPKEITRFMGPRLFVRRVPIWASKSLGASYIEETALCAGDVLVVRHAEDNARLLKGLCVFLNSAEVADFIIAQRPSVGHRDSFPKISAKDARMPSRADMEKLSEKFE
jgi:predicted RNA methylase